MQVVTINPGDRRHFIDDPDAPDPHIVRSVRNDEVTIQYDDGAHETFPIVGYMIDTEHLEAA